MKVLLYFESQDKIKTSGIGRALKHQIQALTSNGVEYTLDPKDSFDIAHINTYFPKAKHLVKKLKRKGVPVIVHGHSTVEDFRNSFRGWKLMSLWFNPNLKWFYSHADHIITPSAYSKELIDSYNLGTSVEFISNGIDPKLYEYKKEDVDAFKEFFKIKENEKVIIGVGFPFNRKGLKDFFEVAKSFPDIKFIWFGALAKILTQHNILKAIKHRPENVLMPGYIDNKIIRGAYHYAECLFFPSYEETEGIVVLESLASHCVTLVRDIGVYKDWLEDGRDCYKAKNNAEFVEKIKKIISSDNSKIKENGMKLVNERSLEVVGKELKGAYQRVLDNYHAKK